MPKISIITTTYNHSSFIAQTIDSILHQTFSDWELLIGDDSPNDETRNIIQSYVKKYPNTIKARHHQPNKGIVDNMNFLLAQTNAQSEYLAFLEGDDLRHPEYLAKKIQIFATYPNVGLVYNELSTIDEQGNILEERRIAPRTKKRYRNEKDTLGHYLANDIICFGYSTLMSRKYDIYINNYGKKDLMGTEGDFFLQIATKYPVYGISQPLSSYRKHSHNTSKSLAISIQHFEFLVNKYIETGQIDSISITRVNILITMMKCMENLQHKKRKSFFHNAFYCYQLSIFHTLVVGFNSIRYRMLNPIFYSLTTKQGKKPLS